MIVYEIIGVIVVVGLIALGVERYIEFLKSKSAPAKTEPDNGEK